MGRPSAVADGGFGRTAADAGVCRLQAGHVVVELLRAFRGAPQKLATALEGRTLAIEVVIEGSAGGRFLLLFSPDGVVYRMKEDALRSDAFQPHVTLRGTPEELAAVLCGQRETADAVFARTVTLHVERTDDLLPHYPQVMRFVAEELTRLLHR